MNQDYEIVPLSRKEREKKSRKQEILSAARILFSQKGYHDTTLEEIANKAEFAKGTIYNYFRNKDELFFGIVESVFDTLYEIAESSFSTPGVQARARFADYAKKIMRYSYDHSDLFKIMMREGPRGDLAVMEARMNEMKYWGRRTHLLIVQVLQREFDEGRLRPIDPLESAILFDSMLKCYSMQHVKVSLPRSESDIEQSAELIVTIFFDGIQQTQKEEP